MIGRLQERSCSDVEAALTVRWLGLLSKWPQLLTDIEIVRWLGSKGARPLGSRLRDDRPKLPDGRKCARGSASIAACILRHGKRRVDPKVGEGHHSACCRRAGRPSGVWLLPPVRPNAAPVVSHFCLPTDRSRCVRTHVPPRFARSAETDCGYNSLFDESDVNVSGRELEPGNQGSRRRVVPACDRVRFRPGTCMDELLHRYLGRDGSQRPSCLSFFSLQLSPLQLGLLDGLQQGASAFVRLIGGYLADWWTRYKQVALAGYALSAIVKAGYLVVGAGWGWIAGLIVADCVGKGIRTAPRDALISLSSRREELGTSFGVHRAFDTAGAMLGPVLAFGLLALVPGQFDAIFVVSLSFALVGISVLWLFVPSNRPLASHTARAACDPPVSLAAAAGLLRERDFRSLTLAGVLLGFATISDAFLYLSIQQRLQLNVGLFPLLFVVTAAAYMVFAIPMGRLSDRFGRGRILLGGYRCFSSSIRSCFAIRSAGPSCFCISRSTAATMLRPTVF